MQLGSNPNLMNRLHLAASMYNDQSILQLYQTKYQRRKSAIKKKVDLPKKPDTFQNVNDQVVQNIEETLYVEERPITKSSVKGRLAPSTFKITTQVQETIEKPEDVLPDFKAQSQKAKKASRMEKLYKNDISEKPFQNKLKVGCQSKKYEFLNEQEFSDEKDNTRLVSTQINHRNSNIIKQIQKQQQMITKQKQLEQEENSKIVVQHYYDSDLFSDYQPQKSEKQLRFTSGQSDVKLNNSPNYVKSTLAQQNTEQGAVVMVCNHLSSQIQKIVATLNSKLFMKSKQQEKSLQQLKYELKLQKNKNLLEVEQLNNHVQQLVRQIRGLKSKQMQKINQTKKKLIGSMSNSQMLSRGRSLQLLQLDPDFLFQLQNKQMELSASNSMWIERGYLSCMACMGFCGMDVATINTSMNQIINDDKDEDEQLQNQNGQKHNEFDLIKEAVQTQIDATRNKRNLYGFTKNDRADSRQFGASSPSYQQNSSGAVQMDDFFNMSPARQPEQFVKTEDLISNSQLTKPQLDTGNLFNLQQQKERFIMFPCGDSICAGCTERVNKSLTCPVCFSPVNRIAKSKLSVFNNLYSIRFKDASQLLETLTQQLSLLIQQCEQV